MKASGKGGVESAVSNVYPIEKFLAPETERASNVDADRYALLENAPIGIHWVNADGIIIWANHTELAMLGYSRDEFVGRHLAEFHVDADVIADIFDRLKRGESLSGYEARLRRKDGSIRIGAIDSNVVRQGGEFIHTRCFTRDVTVEKRLAEQARTRFEDLETIYRTAPIGLALVDQHLRFVRVNERLARINGIPAERHIGHTLRELVPDLADQAEEVLRRVLKTGEHALNVEFHGETPAQPRAKRHWLASYHPIRGAAGAVTGINVVIEEITDRKRTEAALAESARVKGALYELTDGLHRAQSLDDVYNAALLAITNALVCDRASILLFDAAGVMRFVGWSGLSESYRKAVEGHSPWTRAAKDPQPIYIDNVERSDLDERLKATVRQEGIGSLGFVPLIANGRLIGKFMTYFDTPRLFSAEEVELSLSIARQLAFGIEHRRAAEALRESERYFREMIDALPVAIYTTDAEGRLTHINPAAVEFSGRVPELGTDRWCVSWKLYHADGTPLPHDECPMAVALKEGRVVSGVEAIVERPDGTRRWFTPYPTPLHDAGGRVIGGINMLLDITERKEAERGLAHFAAIVASSADAILSKTLDGIVRSWNASSERMFGYTAEEMIGQPVRRLIPSDRQQEEDEILGRLKAGEHIEHYETVRVTKHGHPIEVSLTISPVKDRCGRIIGASKIARDITERKRTEELVRKQAAQLALVADTAPVYIAHCDADARFKFVNKAYAKRFGLRPEDCVGLRIADLLGEFVHESVRPYIATVMSGNAVEFELDVEVPGATAGPRFMHCSYAPERDADNRVVGWVAAVTDITERRRVEEALRTSEDKLKDTDRRKDEFLAMLAHELRNPLAPIANAVHLLRQSRNENTVQQQARAIIERQSGRLARLVDDLLEVSRITTGRIQLHMERIAIGGIVERAVETVEPLVEQHRHKLSITLPPDALWLYADGARLEQVIVNLLTNATKYTDDGGRIDVDVFGEHNQVVVRVKDTGIGISPELLPHVFDLFTQSERSLDRSHGGLGIGLSLVQRLVSMHGGSVVAESVLGKGSEFSVRLPQASIPAGEIYAAAVPPNESAVHPLRVLVVDDNVDAAQSLSMLLEVSGHVVWMAHDGQAAIAAVSEYRPQIVLLDIGLPKLDGFTVAKRLREEPALHGIVLVAITGYGQAMDHQRSRDAGFDHHLVKPVAFSSVEEILVQVGARGKASAASAR